MVEHVDLALAYVLTVGLLFLLILVIFEHRQRTGRGLAIGVLAGFIGVTLGSIATFAVHRAASLGSAARPASPAIDATSLALATGEPAGQGSIDDPLDSNPKRELAALVSKLNLLTDDIQLKLTSEQGQALVKSLSGVDDGPGISDSEAEQMVDELMSVLSADQQAKLRAIGLPAGSRGPVGAGIEMDENPFRREQTLQALKAIRERFGSVAQTSR